jgi:gluconate 5-dehydrogenase
MKSVRKLFDLGGRQALVTGGSGRLGFAIGGALAQAGASVLIAGRDAAKSEAAAARIRADGGEARAVKMDVTNTRSVERALAGAGALDILVNNAIAPPPGLPNPVSPRRARFPEDADWKGGLDVTLGATFRLIRSAVPRLRRGKGSIINIATMYALVSPDHRVYGTSGEDSPAYYGAGKAGMLQLTRYYARLLGPEGIRVNALSPGPFPSAAVKAGQPALMRRLAAKTALGRLGEPDELMGAVVFLSGDASSYLTGQNLVVDGGWTC